MSTQFKEREGAEERNRAGIAEAIAWLEKHWRHDGRDYLCEICGRDLWEVGARVTIPLADPPVEGGLGSIIGVPFHPITCQTCANTKLLNAFTAGLEKPASSS
jgi:hypothetical protein